jgi:hypothetical protein
LENIQFVTTQVGFTSGVEGIWKSTDGGASFFSITPTDSSGRGFWGCYFLDENTGVVVGGGCDNLQRFYKTTNGGTSWTLFQTTVLNSGLTDVILYPNGTGYAVSSGIVWQTTDTGSTWSFFKNTPTPYWQEEISKINNSFLIPVAGITCSGNGGGGGMNFSTDLGNTWNTSNTSYPIFGACLTSETTGWACGYGRSILYTSNAGQSWQIRNCGIQNVDLDDITFLTPDDGWVCGKGVYKLGPTEIKVSKDSLGFGEICYPEFRKDSLKVVNLSFYPADLKVSIINDFSKAYTVLTPNFNSQMFDCDSVGIVVQFSPPASGTYSALLVIQATSGDGKTTFYKDVILYGVGTRSSVRAENKSMVFDSVPCNVSRIVDLKWYSDDNSEMIKSYSELKDDKNQITMTTGLPAFVTRGGTSTQFRLNLLDTGWVYQEYKFVLLPCNIDTIIQIAAYGVSPIITSIDSLHFVSHCKGSIIDTIPVRNTGNALLSITNTSIVGNPTEVQILGWTSKRNYPVNIPQKSVDSIIIRFNPQQIGITSYQLKLDNNDLTLARGNKNPLNVLLVGRRESELISIKDTVIDFSKICINSKKDSIITLENVGNLTAVIEHKNQTKEPFSIQLPWNFTINKKEKAQFAISFAPKNSGNFKDTILLKTGDCNYLRIYVTGIGIESKLAETPSSINLTLKSNESKDVKLQLRNVGNDLLNIRKFSLVPPTTDFTFTLNPSLTQTLDISQQIDFTLSILSKKNAFYKGQICFEASGLCPANICIPIELISIDRYLTLADTTDFGLTKCIGHKLDTIWIHNAGATADTLLSYDLEGSNAFSLAGLINSPNSIPAGDSLGIIVKFETDIEGDYEAKLTVQSIEPDGQTLQTIFKAKFKKSIFDISKDFIDFGTFERCDNDTTITVTLHNKGLLDDELISYSSLISAPFSAINYSSLAFIGNSKQEITISLSLKTNPKGLVKGHIYWYSETCGDTLKFDFQANFIDPKLTYTSSNINFGSVWVNDKKNESVVVTNNSSRTRTIGSIKNFSNPFFKLISPLPLTFDPGESKDIVFAFNPTSPGNFSDSLIIEEFSVCHDTLSILLQGSTPTESYLATIEAGNYETNAGDTVIIEISLNPSLDRIQPDSIKFELGFDKYLVFPIQLLLQTQVNSFANHSFNYSDGKLSAGFNDAESKNIFALGGNIMKIKSLALASSPNFTLLKIEKFDVFTSKDLAITKKDGSFKIKAICDPEGSNHIQVFLQADFSILSNISGNSEVVLKFENITSGQFLEMYNLFGVKINEIALERGSYEKIISLNEFPSGIYFITLRPYHFHPKKIFKDN